jgi:hypothetical protein
MPLYFFHQHRLGRVIIDRERNSLISVKRGRKPFQRRGNDNSALENRADRFDGRSHWHWNIGALVNVPVGEWERGRLSKLGFNRWALDLNGALTWLDQATGWEFSAPQVSASMARLRTRITSPARNFTSNLQR